MQSLETVWLEQHCLCMGCAQTLLGMELGKRTFVGGIGTPGNPVSLPPLAK